MTFKKRPTDESVATVVLGASPPLVEAGEHLDENDLALLDIESLSGVERQSIRRHLEGCDECRRLVSDVLRQRGDTGEINEATVDSPAEKLRAS